jgi:phosphoribosylglycinamide formyltransferase 1
VSGTHPLAVVVLISGRGSNLQSIIDGMRNGDLAVDLRGVISNCPQASGLERASRAGIPTRVVDHRAFQGRGEFERALRHGIDLHEPDLLVLAGFMRVLGADFVRHYAGRMINIHPSLLPAYRGLHTHERVLAAGDRKHGASVHFVTPELDGGPVIAQIEVPVLAGDDATALADRVLQQEHRLLPTVISWLAAGRVRLVRERVLFDGVPLTSPRQVKADAQSV